MSAFANLAPKLALPTLFLAYAAVADVGFVNSLNHNVQEIPKSAIAYFDGGAAKQIDAYYKSLLPHRTPSIDLMGAMRYLVFKEGRAGVVVGKDGWLYTSEEFHAAALPAAALTRAAGEMSAVRDQLAAAGIKLVVVPLPAKADIYREHAADPAVSDDLADVYTNFVATLTQEGIATVDVRQSLLDAKPQGPLFLQRDTHWTPLGAEITANLIGHAEAADLGTTDYKLATGKPVERSGDLTSFIVTGGLAQTVGLGPELVTPWQSAAAPTAADASDLFGNAAIPFALVGTSYSANEQWGFAASLRVALRSDVLSLAEEGLGPVAPMKKFLKSDTLRDSPPKTVIWEFPVRYLATAGLWDGTAKVADGKQ